MFEGLGDMGAMHGGLRGFGSFFCESGEFGAGYVVIFQAVGDDLLADIRVGFDG